MKERSTFHTVQLFLCAEQGFNKASELHRFDLVNVLFVLSHHPKTELGEVAQQFCLELTVGLLRPLPSSKEFDFSEHDPTSPRLLRKSLVGNVDRFKLDRQHWHMHRHVEQVSESIEYFPCPILIEGSVLRHSVFGLDEQLRERLSLAVIEEVEVVHRVGVVIAA